MNKGETVIEAVNISKSFDVKSSVVPALQNVFVNIKSGEFIVITGPSGCGKSTLLHILLGLEAPTTGTIKFLGNDIYSNLSEDERTEIRKKEIGMIYQQPNWIKSLSVLENVMFAQRINGESDINSRFNSLSVLEKVGMRQWSDYIPTELSFGQQQKVALARAIVTNPQIIIADEPTGNLDFQSGQELMKQLKELNDKGHTIIMVTHDLEYLAYATRSLIMFDGKIVGNANKNELEGKIGSFKDLMKTVVGNHYV